MNLAKGVVGKCTRVADGIACLQWVFFDSALIFVFCQLRKVAPLTQNNNGNMLGHIHWIH